MPEAKSGDAVAFLDQLLEFFEDGRRWTRGRFYDHDGNRCLVGAINYVQHTYNINAVAAEVALHEALPERRSRPPGRYIATDRLIVFNDTRTCFTDIRKLILDARALTVQTPGAIEAILKHREEAREAARAKRRRAAARRKQEAQEAKCRFLAEIRRERAAAHPAKLPEAEAEEDARRREAAERTKRWLLAEIERERAMRAATGDTGPTWISCPCDPVHERLAA